MLKDGGEKESQAMDRLDLRDKGQPVFEVCRGLRGISQDMPPKQQQPAGLRKECRFRMVGSLLLTLVLIDEWLRRRGGMLIESISSDRHFQFRYVINWSSGARMNRCI